MLHLRNWHKLEFLIEFLTKNTIAATDCMNFSSFMLLN